MKTTSWIAWALFGVTVAAGCSGSGATNADGAVGAGGFVVKDTVYTRLSVLGDDQVIIHLTNLSGLCNLFTSTTKPPTGNYDLLTLELDVQNGTVTTGQRTFTLPPSGDAAVVPTTSENFASYGGIRNCNTRYGGNATGTINLTALDDTHAVGTYDLDFADGWPFSGHPTGGAGHTSGSFDAPACDLMGHLGYVTCN
jgi:hypothetical protein